MDRKKLVLLVSALVVAIGTAFVARSLFTGAAAPDAAAAPVAGPVVPAGPKVLVAQRTLPPGTIITADALSFQPWPAEMVKDAYFIEGEADMQKLVGTVVRFSMTAGEPVTRGVLISPQDRGFLAAALTPGMRAITVPVSSLSGVAGFIFPGDRVDMMLTQGVDGGMQVSETVLRNLRVLATDQSTAQGVDEAGNAVPRVSGTVTLEVTPRIAEKVTVAQTLGSISFSLRPLADSQSDLERAIAMGTVKLPDNATPEEEEKLLRAAVAQPAEGRTTFVTGADVSRFRKNAPPSGGGAAMAPGGVPVAVHRGPIVKISRGNSVSEAEIGKSGGVTVMDPRSAAVVGSTAAGVSNTAAVLPGAMIGGIQ